MFHLLGFSGNVDAAQANGELVSGTVSEDVFTTMPALGSATDFAYLYNEHVQVVAAYAIDNKDLIDLEEVV